MKREINMYEGALLPSIIRYTVPIILTSLLQLFFNAADLIVVGQFCGSVSVAAVGATGSITGLLVNFFIGLSVGAGVAVAFALMMLCASSSSMCVSWLSRTIPVSRLPITVSQ